MPSQTHFSPPKPKQKWVNASSTGDESEKADLGEEKALIADGLSGLTSLKSNDFLGLMSMSTLGEMVSLVYTKLHEWPGSIFSADR